MSDPVRDAREQLRRAGLLRGVDLTGVVPELVARSWRRSISSKVESAALCQRVQDVDPDSLLSRAAGPVLDRWQQQLADTGTTLFLSDRAGSIVARRATDHALLRTLDRVHAAEGFDYSEDSIGTNGLGTSMVERRAVLIEGSQHYNDALAGLACAAAPVSSPTGAVLGAVSLGGPLNGANALMLSLTREIGQQIEDRLRAVARPQDLALAMSFMRYTNSRRPTVVLDEQSVLANNAGLPYLNVTSHVLLWQLLVDHDWTRTATARFPLHDFRVEVVARRVTDAPRPHFILHFEDRHPAPSPDLRQAAASSAPTPVREHHRAAVVSSVAVDAGSGRTEDGVVIVEGPSGSGRATVARGLHADRTGAAVLVELVLRPGIAPSLADVASRLADGSGSGVLVRRLEALADEHAAALVRMVHDHRHESLAGRRASTLVLTVDGRSAAAPIAGMVDALGAEERTEPLAGRPDRIAALVKRTLDHVDHGRRRTFSPAALQAFVRWDWPGNIAELTETVTALVDQVDVPVIERQHLPEHLRRAPRRRLTLLEDAEREAIIRALRSTGGNKSEAAQLLGVGRTTLYRRLRQLGLDDAEHTLQ